MSEPKQAWLARQLAYQNPLKARFSREFFASIPQSPGTYQFRGAEGTLLYVGKAKDLRARLRSYRSAKPDAVSRKTLRLVHLIHQIEWELCSDEEHALLRENELLRSLRPPFNRANVAPERYPYVLLGRAPGCLELEIVFELAPDVRLASDRRAAALGCFKGASRLRAACQALYRLLWYAHTAHGNAELPQEWVCARTPLHLRIEIPQATRWQSRMRRFFRGQWTNLLSCLSEVLLAREDLPRFSQSLIERDLHELDSFYRSVCLRNQALLRNEALAGTVLIPQEKMDDWIVRWHQQKRGSLSALTPRDCIPHERGETSAQEKSAQGCG